MSTKTTIPLAQQHPDPPASCVVAGEERRPVYGGAIDSVGINPTAQPCPPQVNFSNPVSRPWIQTETERPSTLAPVGHGLGGSAGTAGPIPVERADTGGQQ